MAVSEFERSASGAAGPLVQLAPFGGIAVLCAVVAWLAYVRRFRSKWSERRRLIEQREHASDAA